MSAKKVADASVTIQDLCMRFPGNKSPAIRHLNAVFPAGEMIGVAGPDGAGKTTLIRLIAGLLFPTEGKITVEGYDTLKNPDFIHLLTGYMPQKFGLYEDLTVMQNLNLYADLRGVIGEERKQTFEKLLQFTNLSPFKNRLAGNLSGGMKQKLGLACALINKPTLLLLDEPSVGVDPISRRELWEMVSLLLEEGITVLWSTAYLNEVERCHTVLLLNEGEVLYHGTPTGLTERVKDRVFRITPTTGSSRQLLMHLLNEKGVMDGIIQGSDIRIVTRDSNLPAFSFPNYAFEIHREEPRFEDAFIDILGGGPGGHSVLAEERQPVLGTLDKAIQAEMLTKKFGDFTAAKNVSFTVKKGEIFGLLGPNGAGKSTTFKMLCGLIKPTEGKALVNGLDLSIASGEARARIGYMAQKFSLYGTLSVKQNLSFFAGAYNLSGRSGSAAIENMIKIFSLEDYVSIVADALPLGFKQRLALACANMHDPLILFLDEPTSGVDPLTRREFWNHINGLVEKGVTIMITTHFMDEAEYCDRIALVYRGRVIQMDTPDALKKITRTEQNPNPTLEDAFIHLIQAYDANPLP